MKYKIGDCVKIKMSKMGQMLHIIQTLEETDMNGSVCSYYGRVYMGKDSYISHSNSGLYRFYEMELEESE
jgi:hypothetical protein